MNQDHQKITQNFSEFIDGFNTLILSTCNSDAVPEASYAPFIRDGNTFCIFVSELAVHTRNLINNPRASLLFIEDEDKTQNLFARRRANITVKAEEIPRKSAEAKRLLDKMEAVLGNTVQLLRNLDDFHLFALHPVEASYTEGFGKAYRLTGNSLSQVEHLSRR